MNRRKLAISILKTKIKKKEQCYVNIKITSHVKFFKFNDYA